MAFPPRLQQLLVEGRVVVRSLGDFLFGTGAWYMWNGASELVWNGHTYIPNQLISVDEPGYQTGTAALPITMKMPTAADFGVTPDKLAQIESLDYKGKPVILYDAYFDPDTRALLHVEPMYRGYIDTIDHKLDNGEFYLSANIETAALENHRDGYRSASHEDQQLVSPDDKFFEYASVIKRENFNITAP
ncbi:hypothetical protein GCM10011491_31130 [Brucella endophytica]|uniref:DUF2163 domain-containing protein n=1 Tax=Brucella endophytica TaxID=1963359 RepID=A0A916WIK7_9HYPH|nr:hypothetical protein [Brucella endophytica]GGB00719.1 hypothetical protein GCM10011491_31130 [Brucella endophytica]